MATLPGKYEIISQRGGNAGPWVNPWRANAYERGLEQRVWIPSVGIEAAVLGEIGAYDQVASMYRARDGSHRERSSGGGGGRRGGGGGGFDLRQFLNPLTEINPVSHLDPLRHLRILFPQLPQILPPGIGMAAGLAPAAFGPIAPFLVAAAVAAGMARSNVDPMDPRTWGRALDFLLRQGPRGRKHLDAALRAAHRAHHEGRRPLPPALVRHLDRHGRPRPRPRFAHPVPGPRRAPPPRPQGPPPRPQGPPPPRDRYPMPVRWARPPMSRQVYGRPGDEFRGLEGYDLGDLGIAPVVAAVIGLAPVAIQAITPWLKAAAERAGKGKPRDGRDAARRLAGDARGQRYIQAAIRAALRAQAEGRTQLPPDFLATLTPMQTDSGLPAVQALSGPAAATRPGGQPIPRRLPSIRELAARGRNMTQAEVIARANDVIRLRARLQILSGLAMGGKLTPRGKAQTARAIALYRLAVRLLTPARPYLERVYPQAAIIFETGGLAGADLGVAPAVLVAGVASVAVAVAGAALVGVAGVIGASWAAAKAAETQAVQSEATRRQGIQATREIVDAGIEADPEAAPVYVDAGLDALVNQAEAGELSRQEASRSNPDPGGNQIFGLPWWMVAIGAFIAMREFGGGR